MGSTAAVSSLLGPLLLLLPPLLACVFLAGRCQADDQRSLPAMQQQQQQLVCDVQPCWSLHEQASEHYQADTPGVADYELRQCIVLRTYRTCLSDYYKRFSAACAGDINFRTALKYSDTNIARHNCTSSGPVYPDGPPATASAAAASDRPQPCAFIGRPSYRLCTLFGDPHLHTFGGDCQTCKLVGAWPLVDNKFLTVQVSNELVAGDAMATATTKLTVIVHASKEQSKCIAPEALFYTAENGNLPSTFDDGSTETAGATVLLAVVVPGEHVEIYLRYIDTRVTVLQSGAYLSVAVAMPEEVVDATAGGRGLADAGAAAPQLCHAGCPPKERISFAQFFRAAAANEQAAAGGRSGSGGGAAAATTAAAAALSWPPPAASSSSSRHPPTTVTRLLATMRCRDVGVADFYFDSCVFDLLKTGDLNFTVMAQKAFAEAQRFRRASSPVPANRTDLAIYELPRAAPPSRWPKPQTSVGATFGRASSSAAAAVLAVLCSTCLAVSWTSSSVKR